MVTDMWCQNWVIWEKFSLDLQSLTLKHFLIEGLLDQGWQEMAQNNWGFKCESEDVANSSKMQVLAFSIISSYGCASKYLLFWF